ncbi:uncharacterized protein NECHADRAFT_86266 [Fusarium vanettenii 77-13-4]|uniref:Heterokaryon incompatibility domain-containing protein n=1 Tax=Fusarium vanettenii (strain ATCC MYA-4622 / CBS 123669 / FGSC 9596 / NRRL 45880 / 77-13-4) TaxID=660122 RepID=C7ZEU4_FUSV7|nr:uncharacterized protein NECHADRAFT_86266 [Fusarium vanettenii 77-13-4]EEU37354.1 hypothetical protein NECHADRAFT_86266 [Fusarium vanettenii 77-13-4]
MSTVGDKARNGQLAALSLCSDCLKITFDKAFLDRSPVGRESIRVTNIGTHYRQPQDVDCVLCRILSRLKPPPRRWRRPAERRQNFDKLYAFSFVERSGVVNRRCSTIERHQLITDNDSWCLAIEPWELLPEHLIIWHIFSSSAQHGFAVFRRLDHPSPPLFSVQPINRHFDPSLARMWLDYCQSYHKRLCSRSKSKSHITGLQLIDCNSRIVEPALQGTQYVALSYVWGISSTDDTPNFSMRSQQGDVLLPTVLPKTVSDTIDVTKRLGFQYLWVDRYCIDQNDAHAQHDQIAQMNSIYHNASLTIIAAAGQDPEYGLPGVGSRGRNEQPAVRIGCGDVELRSTMRHPHDTIRSSKWSTRAWTFQEGVLSRRRLVFTDDQVYFECSAMNCHESITCWNSRASLDRLHMKDRSRFRNAMRAGMFGRNHDQVYGLFDERKLQPYQAFVRFQRMVEQYSGRDLSYDSDALEAFSGILDKFVNSLPQFHHIHGIPFMAGEGVMNPEEWFLQGLVWQSKPPDPATDYQYRPRRRLEFPSWSWAGWQGEIGYINHGRPGDWSWESGVKSLSLELENGSVRTTADHIRCIQQKALDPLAPSVIQIRTAFLPSSVVFSENPYDHLRVFYSFLDRRTPVLSPSKFYEAVTKKGFRKCIYMGESSSAGLIFMVIEPNDATWSRTGLLFVPSGMLPRGRRSWRRNIGTFRIS